MKLKEVREITGLSERTLKSYIQQGRLEATLVGSGQHRYWEINPESLKQIDWKPKDDTDNIQQSDQQLLIIAQQHQLEIYERELEAKISRLSNYIYCSNRPRLHSRLQGKTDFGGNFGGNSHARER